jgi:hypothetical protein
VAAKVAARLFEAEVSDLGFPGPPEFDSHGHGNCEGYAVGVGYVELLVQVKAKTNDPVRTVFF